MTAMTTTATMNQAWEAAIAQADTITLPDHLWERPQVKGFTIDGPTSRDLDDSIWIRETDEGAIASIHIADVAELVPLDSAIDKIALARTQTKYLKWGNEPMIPRTLSENLLSLLEGQRRPTLTIQITLNEQAEIAETEIFESWLTSKQKFSYEWADIACQQGTTKLHFRLKLCQTWAVKLSQNRQAHGAFGGLLSKSGILFDENGNVVVPEGRLFHSQMMGDNPQLLV